MDEKQIKVFAVCMKKARIFFYPKSRRFLIDCADGQDDLKFHWTLRKHAYSNILKILLPKNENFQIKNSIVFLISAQNIDCGYSLEPPRRGGSNEYPQSMFLNRNKKNNVRKIMYTPVNPSFTILKWGLRGSKLYRYVSWWRTFANAYHIWTS